jgi:hypothetical protein
MSGMSFVISTLLIGFLLGIFFAELGYYGHERWKDSFYKRAMRYRQRRPTIEERAYCFQLLQWLTGALSAQDLLAEMPDVSARLRRALKQAERADIPAVFTAFACELRQSLPKMPTIEERAYCLRLLEWLEDDHYKGEPLDHDVPKAKAEVICVAIVRLALDTRYRGFIIRRCHRLLSALSRR